MNPHESGSETPRPWTQVEPAVNTEHAVRLVVCDMDGTLLDSAGRIPDEFWPLLDAMRARGIAFAPASGRQYATLARMFDHTGTVSSFVAENGTMIVHEGSSVVTSSLDRPVVSRIVEAVRGSTSRGYGLVCCGSRGAYIEQSDSRFLAEVEKYYAALSVVDDLHGYEDETLKLAIYDSEDVQGSAAQLGAVLRGGSAASGASAGDGSRGSGVSSGSGRSVAAAEVAGRGDEYELVVSSRHWADIMPTGANKGVGVRALQRELGVTPAQTVAFGDYLNDLELLGSADLSFAMANAHPDVRARARYVAPANDERGVVAVLSRLLGIEA
ncbi:MAG: Cof-type HAD-IIB family hydrolase [Leucobacter sp.]